MAEILQYSATVTRMRENPEISFGRELQEEREGKEFDMRQSQLPIFDLLSSHCFCLIYCPPIVFAPVPLRLPRYLNSFRQHKRGLELRNLRLSEKRERERERERERVNLPAR